MLMRTNAHAHNRKELTTEVVAVDAFEFVFEIFEENQVIMISERFEERLALMVSGNEHCCAFLQLVFCVGVYLISLKPSVFVLKVYASLAAS